MVLSDAHLSAATRDAEAALLAFLEEVPRLGDSLLVNGDLFDFWFAYRRAVPRDGLRVVSALAQLRRRLPILMTGGNHDRWGHRFWTEELGIAYAPDCLRFRAAGRDILSCHGDDGPDAAWRERLLRGVVRHPLTLAAYRWVHPDLGLALVPWWNRRRTATSDRDAAFDAAARTQRTWAASWLEREPAVDLLVLGHTHRPLLAEPVPGRWVLNPGAWIDGYRYAIVTADAVTLHTYAWGSGASGNGANSTTSAS